MTCTDRKGRQLHAGAAALYDVPITYDEKSHFAGITDKDARHRRVRNTKR